MRLVVAAKHLKPILRWTQRILLAAAVSMFAYCGFVLLDAWIFQKSESSQLEQLRASRPAAGAAARPTAPPSTPATAAPDVVDGLIGRLEIARLALSVIVMEGTSRTTLRRAVGHVAGTALPGRPGNVGLAGHRDTFFRPLRNIREDDIITLTTLQGEYRYRVVSLTIVRPNDIGMLGPSPKESLTLITCYPFAFIGSAPDRFIVRALRIT